MPNYFTGIGSRMCPLNISPFIHDIVTFLYSKNYILRSGGASGADSFFEAGVPPGSPKEIYLPWKKFNGNKSSLYDVSDEAKKLASKYHPAWKELSQGAKLLHARNMYQVFGQDLKTKSDFIVCWTPDAKIVGGTAQALRAARLHNITIFNLADGQHVGFIKECMQTDQIFINNSYE